MMHGQQNVKFLNCWPVLLTVSSSIPNYLALDVKITKSLWKNWKSNLNIFQTGPTLKHHLCSEEHVLWQNKDYAVIRGQNPKGSHGLQRPNIDWRSDCKRSSSVNSQRNYFSNPSAFGMEMRPLLWVQGMRQNNNVTSLHLGEWDLLKRKQKEQYEKKCVLL